MNELLETFLFPKRIGNPLHGFFVAFSWLLIGSAVFLAVLLCIVSPADAAPRPNPQAVHCPAFEKLSDALTEIDVASSIADEDVPRWNAAVRAENELRRVLKCQRVRRK